MNFKDLWWIALSLVMITTFSCKKDKKAETPVPIGNGYNSNYVEGAFSFMKIIDVHGNNLGDTSCITTSRLFNRRIYKDSVDAYFGTSAGRIGINSILLRNNKVDYTDSTFTSFYPPFKVKNLGSDTGSYRVALLFNQAFPKYSGFSSLPDTIYKASEMVVKVKGYSNCNSIQVWLGNGTTGLLLKQLEIGDTIARFPRREPEFDIFQNFPQITLVFSQNQVQFINGKNYYISTTTQYNLWDRPFSEH